MSKVSKSSTFRSEIYPDLDVLWFFSHLSFFTSPSFLPSVLPPAQWRTARQARQAPQNLPRSSGGRKPPAPSSPEPPPRWHCTSILYCYQASAQQLTVDMCESVDQLTWNYAWQYLPILIMARISQWPREKKSQNFTTSRSTLRRRYSDAKSPKIGTSARADENAANWLATSPDQWNSVQN